MIKIDSYYTMYNESFCFFDYLPPLGLVKILEGSEK